MKNVKIVVPDNIGVTIINESGEILFESPPNIAPADAGDDDPSGPGTKPPKPPGH